MPPGSKHGYEAHSDFSSNMNQFWHLSMSQIYALLKRMEKNGVVVSREKWQENRPAKKIFSITQAGKERFIGALALIDKQIEVFQSFPDLFCP